MRLEPFTSNSQSCFDKSIRTCSTARYFNVSVSQSAISEAWCSSQALPIKQPRPDRVCSCQLRVVFYHIMPQWTRVLTPAEFPQLCPQKAKYTPGIYAQLKCLQLLPTAHMYAAAGFREFSALQRRISQNDPGTLQQQNIHLNQSHHRFCIVTCNVLQHRPGNQNLRHQPFHCVVP